MRLPALALCLVAGLAGASSTAVACRPAVAAASDTCSIEPAAAATTPMPDTVALPAALPAPPHAKALRDQTRQILNGPDFHSERLERQLVMREWLQRWLTPDLKKKPKAEEPFNLAALAEVIKVVLIIVLGAALLWLLWRGWQWLAPYRTKSAAATRGPVLEAQSVLLADTALPASVSAAARTAWQRGETVLALSLLYRGAVKSLAEQHRVVLPDSATEGECLRLARRSGKAVVSEGFAPIVRAWMALAYARRTPEDFEQLLQVYRRCFEPADTGGRA